MTSFELLFAACAEEKGIHSRKMIAIKTITGTLLNIILPVLKPQLRRKPLTDAAITVSVCGPGKPGQREEAKKESCSVVLIVPDSD
jgi:hypothetical protein